MEYYSLEICNLKRQLPIKAVGRTSSLASFSILGDVELVEKVADQLVEKLSDFEFDCLAGPESKVVPLLHVISKKLGHPRYVVCRKSIKSYMVSPVVLKPLPYFPKHVKSLVLDGVDAELIRNKRVVIIDDVVSTGVTMRMMKKIVEQAEGKVVACAAVIRQGENQFDTIDNFIYLATLPIFKPES